MVERRVGAFSWLGPTVRLCFFLCEIGDVVQPGSCTHHMYYDALGQLPASASKPMGRLSYFSASVLHLSVATGWLHCRRSVGESLRVGSADLDIPQPGHE